MRLSRPFRAFVRLLRPVIVALNGSANLVVGLLGVQPREEFGLVHTPDELALILRESRRQGTLPAQEARVLGAALRLSEIDAEAAMTSRVDLVAVADDAGSAQVLELASETGFTRFPVFHEDLDHVVGLVHVKDILTLPDDEVAASVVGDHLRPLMAVPESRDLEHLLKDMRRDRAHAVLVVDEYGGTAGVLTLEDVLEELVGDIEDEFDPRLPDRRGPGEGRWVVDGTMRRDELRRLTGLELPEAEAETVSGHLTDSLGRLLEPGDVYEHEGWTLTVRRLEGRRAGEVEVVAPRRVPDEP
jgi:CBS domain containing-hemolysin-like protein